jgi:hypothetical protein
MVMYTCDSSTWDIEAGGLQVQDQTGIWIETLDPKRNKIKQYLSI